jgi:hypothetical protein
VLSCKQEDKVLFENFYQDKDARKYVLQMKTVKLAELLAPGIMARSCVSLGSQQSREKMLD